MPAPMPRLGVLFLAAALAGCDLFAEADPAWTQPGAVAVFDYEPGPDSIRTLQPSGVFAAEPAGQRLVAVHVDRAGDWEQADREVRWHAAAAPGRHGTPFLGSAVSLPLDDDVFDVSEYGLRVVVAYQCTGNGWFGGDSGSLAWVRVPRTSGTIEPWSNCSREPGAGYPATASVSVTVPAGTFETVRIERWETVEYWSWEVGLVRVDMFNGEGVLRGRFVRSASS